MNTKIAIFKGKEVRKALHNNEWWFVVEDVVSVLTDSANIKDYINKMRRRDEELSKGYGQFVHTLDVETKGGVQKMNCANTEGIFRIIQSIPSSKAEPFKRWLAKVGYERIQEIEDPELATKRENLRDHMNDLELIFSMLGEASTTEITRNQDVRGFVKSKVAARKGEKIAGDARRKLEIESGKKVSSKENYLQKPQNKKLLKSNTQR